MACRRQVLLLLLVLVAGAASAAVQHDTHEEPSSYLPVVIWHGMGDSCCSPFSMGRIGDVIKEQHNGTYIHSLMIGDNVIDDTSNGFFMNINAQIDLACAKIKEDPKLADGYHAIGFSQGGQFLRAVAQRCPSPAMHSLVSVGGQQQGVFGIPHCPPGGFLLGGICERIRKAITDVVYQPWIQDHVVQAEYWHDPLNETRYRESSVFLADINQENDINEDYRSNLQQLDALVLVKFRDDTMVVPKESSWFGFYTPGQDADLQTLEESTLYTEDRLGLKAMAEADKLHFLTSAGNHLSFTDEWFIQNIIEPFFT